MLILIKFLAYAHTTVSNLKVVFFVVKISSAEKSTKTIQYRPPDMEDLNTRYCRDFHFYSVSALLAMQSAVLARGIPSVRLSVCPSVTFRYCVQTNEDMIVRFSASGSAILLVSAEVKFIRIFAGDHSRRGR